MHEASQFCSAYVIHVFYAVRRVLVAYMQEHKGHFRDISPWSEGEEWEERMQNLLKTEVYAEMFEVYAMQCMLRSDQF